MTEYRCTNVLKDGRPCGAVVGSQNGDVFVRRCGGHISRGPAWCPGCGARYNVRRYRQGKSYRFAMRPAFAEAMADEPAAPEARPAG